MNPGRTLVIVVIITSCASASSTAAGTLAWRGLISGNAGADGETYDLAANWSPLGVPGPADLAIFDLVGSTGTPLYLQSPASLGTLRIAGVTVQMDNSVPLSPANISIGHVTGPGVLELVGGDVTSASWRIGDLDVGSLHLTSGAHVQASSALIGIAGKGTVSIDGPGSSWTHTTGALTLGQGATIGEIDVTNGATLTTAGVTGNNPRFTVSGSGSQWIDTGDIHAGGGPSISNGAHVESNVAVMNEASMSGVPALVEGPGSEWLVQGLMQVGLNGIGVSSGGALTTQSQVEIGSAGIATVSGPGSVWHAVGKLYLGVAGNGLVSVSNGGRLETHSVVRLSGSSPGAMSVSTGGGWSYDAGVVVGSGNSGVLQLVDGGQLEGPGIAFTEFSGADGSILVKDPGSLWHITGNQSVGGNAPSEFAYVAHLVVTDGAALECDGVLSQAYGGEIEISQGARVVTDELSLTCHTNNTYPLISNTGTIRTNRLNLPCSIQTIQLGDFELGHALGLGAGSHVVPSSSTLTTRECVAGIDAAGSLTVAGGLEVTDMILGDLVDGDGTCVVGGAAHASADVTVGRQGHGLLRTTTGTTMIDHDLMIAAEPGSSGEVELATTSMDIGGDVFVGGTRAQSGGTGVLRHTGPGTTTIFDTLCVYPAGTVDIPTGQLTASTVCIKGGALQGTSQITGHVVNGGFVRLGLDGGGYAALQIDGDYAQLQTGVMQLRAGSLAQHDSVMVTGTMTLAGSLELFMPSGFVPQLNDHVRLATAAGFSGQFETVTGLPPASGTAHWELRVEGNSLYLVGEPPVGVPMGSDVLWALIALGLMLCATAFLDGHAIARRHAR